MINVAMDVHVRNSFVKGQGPDGKVLTKGRAGNSLMELTEKLAPVEQAARQTREPVRVVLEATTNSRAIVSMLDHWGTEAGIDLTVDVLDARRLRVIAESQAKCDRLDTDVLLELSRSNLRLPICYIPNDEVFALREHLRGRSDLVRVRTMVKNRVHAILHRRGILVPTKMDLFTQAGRKFLGEIPLEEVGRHLCDQYLAVVDQIDELVEASNRRLRILARDPRWRDALALLDTLPGIGLFTGLTILAELGDLKRFRGRSAVANYAGLVPVVRDSNQKTYRGPLVRHGSRHLRAVLIEAAWTAQGRVPAYEAIYQRIKQRAGSQVAIVAVARRMLEDAWTILMKQQPFRYVAPAAERADVRVGAIG